MPDTPAMRRLPKPVFNIIKRVTSLFVASLTSSGATIQFEPLTDTPSASTDAQRARRKWPTCWRNSRWSTASGRPSSTEPRPATTVPTSTSTPEARPYGGPWPGVKGEIQMELVDGINVMFGNPADDQVERQPYILLLGRDTVENLRAEAAQWGGDAEGIQPDTYLDDMAGEGGRIDMAGDKAPLCLSLHPRGERPHPGQPRPPRPP